MPIYLFGEVKYVNVICPIMFINADIPAANKLCGHYSNYAGVIQRPSHACNISVEAMDDPYHNCNFVKWDDMNIIATEGTREQQKCASQHPCKNAFSDIIIGDPNYKIYGALGTDPLHSIRKCLIGCSLELVVSCMTKTQKN